MRKFFCGLVIVAVVSMLQIGQAAAPIVSTTDGKVQGIVVDGVACFKGIPYAAPPVGELRWRPPQAVKPWSGILQTTEYKSRAAQNADLHEFSTAGGSEDCLYLNVFVPQDFKKPLPVFVWIHGGGLTVGSANDYNPLPLAKVGKSIVVTFNFRLGVLGFFGHPALEGEGHATTNYGLMDQVAALEWVQKNISAFGGDPNNVTIAGQSTGAQSVLALMTSPKAANLFQAAISMSGCTAMRHSYQKAVALKKADDFVKAAGLVNPTAQDLRNLSTEEILRAQTFPSLFTTDGEYLTEQIGDAIRAGHVHDVIFVSGTARNEGSFLVAMEELDAKRQMTADDYFQAAKNIAKDFPNITAEDILREYSLEKYSSPAEAYAAIITDALFAVTEEEMNCALAEKIPVYAYEFADETAPNYLPKNFSHGAAHTYDIPYIFHDFPGGNALPTKLNSRQTKLSQEMMMLWTHVKNLSNQKKWTPYNATQKNYFIFSTQGCKMTTDEYNKIHKLDFWQR
ncbi:MAG: carboxylesterase family protein [Selenomonadaceae bacterium]|nr:carboxylesterase family protein [Selenomonadaceae bacterium]